jgi:hypothetical protein
MILACVSPARAQTFAVTVDGEPINDDDIE